MFIVISVLFRSGLEIVFRCLILVVMLSVVVWIVGGWFVVVQVQISICVEKMKQLVMKIMIYSVMIGSLIDKVVSNMVLVRNQISVVGFSLIWLLIWFVISRLMIVLMFINSRNYSLCDSLYLVEIISVGSQVFSVQIKSSFMNEVIQIFSELCRNGVWNSILFEVGFLVCCVMGVGFSVRLLLWVMVLVLVWWFFVRRNVGDLGRCFYIMGRRMKFGIVFVMNIDCQFSVGNRISFSSVVVIVLM